jgi:hypothetical protein
MKPLPKQGEQNHRRQPAIEGEFYREIQSGNSTIAGGWVKTLGIARVI